MTNAIDNNIIGIWFIPLTKKSDWMGQLTQKDDHIELRYRFRYYSGSKDPFDNTDHKNWYGGKIQKPRDEVIEDLRTLTKGLAEKASAPYVGEVLNHGDVDDFMERLSKQPWVHMRVEGEKN